MVHEDIERAVIIVQYVFPGGPPSNHHPRRPVLRHGEVALDEAEVGSLGLGQPILLHHLADNSSCFVLALELLLYLQLDQAQLGRL